jgi:uncharacterized protein (TIGR02231 family)
MKVIFTLGFFLLASFGFAQEVQKIETTIQDVKVFMSGAELHHVANSRIKEGKQELVFVNLSPDLDPNTVLVEIEPKDVTILSVSSRTNYVDSGLDNVKIAGIKDSIGIYWDRMSILDNKLKVLETEKSLLFKNESIGGTSNNVPVAEIQRAADFYRSRMNQIDEEIFKMRKDRDKATEKYYKYNQQLTELNAQFNPPTSEINVVIVSNKAQNVSYSVKYQVANAGWEAKYDVRATGVTKPVELVYRANVYNNCGLDWNGVKLNLSTADPKQGAEKPRLENWDLANQHRMDYDGESDQFYGFTNGQANELMDKRLSSVSEKSLEYKSQEKSEEFRKKNQAPQVAQEMIEVAELNAEFDIVQNYTILSDAKPYIVEVAVHTLPATYEHYTVPKMDLSAFLTARVVGWNKLSLVSGSASVYYNGAYLGSSYINTAIVEDTLVLSLGRDKMISITREKKSEENKKQFSGSNVKETLTYEIVVKNNRDGQVTCVVEDQLPISSSSDIEVTAIETSDAELDKESGKLSWKLTLAPGESRVIKLSYSIKSPKWRHIDGDRHVRRAKAKF